MAALVAVAGCGDSASLLVAHDHLPRITPVTQEFGIELGVAPTRIADLRYRAPAPGCDWTYEIAATHDPPTLHEPDSISHFAIDGAPDSDQDRPAPVSPPRTDTTLEGDAYFSGRLYYRGFRAEKNGVARDIYLSRLHAGPTAPTAGCLPQTWDPVEDAMTLGWPKLTGRVTALEESWTGNRVAGKCNRSACVDPKTGGGGPDNHDRVCVTMDWKNTLLGVYEAGPNDHLALIRSVWTDGHGEPEPDNTIGLWSERTTLVSLEHGRPVWARTVVHHSFPYPVADKSWAPVTRTWVMRAIDECPGSPASMGWSRPQDVVDAAADTLERLAKSEDLLKSHRRSTREREKREQSFPGLGSPPAE